MSVNIYDKETGELIKVAGNSNTEIDDINISNKTTYSSEKIENSLTKKANDSDLTTHTSDTDIHITPAERAKWNNSANSGGIINGSCVVKKTVLYEGSILQKGTYTLADDVNNYDYILIACLSGGVMQTHIVDRDTWVQANPLGMVQINHGNKDGTHFLNFRLSGSILNVINIDNMNPKTITGYKFG